jgi:hypothetical protein
MHSGKCDLQLPPPASPGEIAPHRTLHFAIGLFQMRTQLDQCSGFCRHPLAHPFAGVIRSKKGSITTSGFAKDK